MDPTMVREMKVESRMKKKSKAKPMRGVLSYQA